MPDPIIDVVAETTSTNDLVRERLVQGAAPPFWVRAERQTAGRGRRGRSWAQAQGNLYLSGVIECDVSLAQAAQLSFVAALAVTDVLALWVEPGALSVKWPNDVLLSHCKTAGLLLEADQTERGVQIIVGIGVNIANAPEGVDQDITCVHKHLAHDVQSPPDAHGLAQSIAATFMSRFRQWQRAGFEPQRAAWLARAYGLGCRVTASTPAGSCAGVFEALNENGALVLRLDTGELRSIAAADAIFHADAETGPSLRPVVRQAG